MPPHRAREICRSTRRLKATRACLFTPLDFSGREMRDESEVESIYEDTILVYVIFAHLFDATMLSASWLRVRPTLPHACDEAMARLPHFVRLYHDYIYTGRQASRNFRYHAFGCGSSADY